MGVYFYDTLLLSSLIRLTYESNILGDSFSSFSFTIFSFRSILSLHCLMRRVLSLYSLPLERSVLSLDRSSLLFYK